MISYAQNFEDVLLHRVFREKKDGFYIDVGAADPTIESVTKFFYDEGWSGINIDPNPAFYEKLVEQRPRDISLNMAVGAMEEERDMYLFQGVGNSTFIEGVRDLYAAKGYDNRIAKVKVSTLAQVCRDFVKRPIDFLKIDAEGWEKQVLEGADWEHFRPTILLIEATEPGSQVPAWNDWEPMLVRDYEMVYFDGLNRFYALRERAGLQQHFRLPVSVHDEFKLFGTAVAEDVRDRLSAEKEQLELHIKGVEGALQIERAENASVVDQMNVLHDTLQSTQEEVCLVQSSLMEAKQSLRSTEDSLQHLQAKNERLQIDLQAVQTQALRKAEAFSEELRAAEHNWLRSQQERSELTAKLLESRRWVGELSQELAIQRMKAAE